MKYKKFKKNGTHFGLTLPLFICKNFEVSFCYFIAKSLLFYPYITPQDTKLFLRQKKIWKDIKHHYDNYYMNDPYSQTRIRYFSVFIHNIIKSFVESQTKTLLKQNKPITFDQKIYEWIIAFTYPTIEELNEVAIEVNASCGECLAGWLFNMISCAEHYEEVTAEKIAEYIFVYKDHLSIEHFAHLMRLYSSKIRSKELSSYPFDVNVNNNIDRLFSRTEDEVHIHDTIRFNIPNASNVNPLNPKS